MTKHRINHAADLTRSPRLQRVFALLSQGGWHSTRAVINAAQVCAVNSIMDELRKNQINVLCKRTGNVWLYALSGANAI